MSDLTDVPGKVQRLINEVDRLKRTQENTAGRMAALEIKDAAAGKLALTDLVKIAGVVVSVSTAVSYLVGIYVEGQLSDALQEVRVHQARTETAVDFLKGTREKEGGEQ